MRAALACVVGAAVAATAVAAGAPPSRTRLPAVIVFAGDASADGYDMPASLQIVRLEQAASSKPGINLSELLSGTPGVLARDRQNHAQDTQLSIRGFGARSTFGVRGLRLYADGLPATAPDGAGQVTHYSLEGADRIEILRGPFSALYGNSSGGVVQIFSADGGPPTRIRASAIVSGHATSRVGAHVLGGSEAIGYNIAASRFETAGYRTHSRARRTIGNARLHAPLGDGGSIAVVANRFDLPDAQDPQGLTRAQVAADARAAAPAALDFDTRKSVEQQQLGTVWRQPFGTHELQASAYAGRRDVAQVLSVPVAAQRNPLHAGGVVQLDNRYNGGDLRWRWQGEGGGRPLDATAGLSLDRQHQRRQGYENFVGAQLGVRGRLRRDELNIVSAFDQFAQVGWQPAPAWSVLAGARHSEVRFRSRDDYVTASNPDDGGSVRFRETTPVLGVLYAPVPQWRLHLACGRGFETPTTVELGYRADGTSGLAFDLRPARSLNAEAGVRWRPRSGIDLQLAAFRADTDDELAVASSVGGRTTFRNVGRARRQGIEASVDAALGDRVRLQFAYTRLDAEFRMAFASCGGTGCATPDLLVAAGTRIPGVAEDQAHLRVEWQAPRGWDAAIEADAVGAVTVNDTGSARAPGYGLVALEAGRDAAFDGGTLRAFVRLDNAFDRRYIGSAIVNDANGRYYEPGADRTMTFGMRVAWE